MKKTFKFILWLIAITGGLTTVHIVSYLLIVIILGLIPSDKQWLNIIYLFGAGVISYYCGYKMYYTLNKFLDNEQHKQTTESNG